ncbi:hypothetical protein GCM10010405_14150 [Streptomyces macrosporus]|uniref:Uncharacterized protein n=1 Tax=Streptomyces macrosporus TaxID=44032 RepID=A0ABN3JJL2_9ACTN
MGVVGADTNSELQVTRESVTMDLLRVDRNIHTGAAPPGIGTAATPHRPPPLGARTSERWRAYRTGTLAT